jgi:hypothetical protein
LEVEFEYVDEPAVYSGLEEGEWPADMYDELDEGELFAGRFGEVDEGE